MSHYVLRPFRIPMTMRFRRVEHRAGVLIRGEAGWGEFSPFPDYGPAYAARWLAAARAHADEPFPPPRRDHVPVNASIPAVPPARAAALVRDSGCSTAKVKVAEPGDTLADDLDRVAAVRDALGRGGGLRVDANGAWDLESAVMALTRLRRYDLEYAEQPVATLEEMAALRRRVDVPLAVDESLRTAEDPRRVAGLDAADVLVVKVQPLGGVHRALEAIDAAGLPAVVSSALETSVGLAAGVALAATLPELPFACGLGTGALLAGDVVADDPVVARDGAVTVGRRAPDAALLDTWAPAPDEAAALLDGMAAADAASSRFLP